MEAKKKAIAISTICLFSLIMLPGSLPSSRYEAGARTGLAAAVGGASSAVGLGAAASAVGGAASAAVDSLGSSADGGADRGLYYTAYRVVRGDTLSNIAEQFNVTLDTVVSFNGIRNARGLQPGTLLKIPSMAGVLYTAKAGDTASSVAAANGISADRIVEANGLMSGDLEAGRPVFLPDAKLASFTLREISGDLFQWPARAGISSWYGWRSDPFSGARVFHNGIDIAVDFGTSVRAAMDGVVDEVGYNSSYGNYVVLSHHAGWGSLYGHLQTALVKEGQRVSAGQRIALSGNTGYSTGPHLHFSVFKYGRTVNPYNVLH